MSYQTQRNDFMTTFGAREGAALALLRYATTAHRLAELQCSGGYPFEYDGASPKQLQACKSCESLTFKRALLKSGICPACRVDQLAEQVATSAGLTLELQGDPRGAPFYVHTSDGRKYAVPARPSTLRW